MSYLIPTMMVSEPNKCKRAIIALPGRGGDAEDMICFCDALDLPDTLLVALNTRKKEWYPQPNSPEDQKKAVNGLSYAMEEILGVVEKVKNGWNFTDQDITLLGHSAGGVMSIHTAIHSPLNIQAVVSLAGAILEPTSVPPCAKDTSFVLQHNIHDECFKWHERYVPMEKSLKKQKYNIHRIIGDGGHNSFTYSIANKLSDVLYQIYKIKRPSDELSDTDEQEQAC